MQFISIIKRLKTSGILAVLIFSAITAVADPIQPPVAAITATPNPGTVVEGGIMSSIFINPTSGTAPFRYAWKKNGVFLPNDTTRSISRLCVTQNDAGVYTCVVSNAAGQIETNGYTLNVTPATGVPAPAALVNKTFAEGGQASLLITFSGTSPKATSWQWYKDGVAIPAPAGTEASGGSSGLYTVNNIPVSASGSYYCVLRNSQGTTTTNTITVTVTPALVAPTLGLNGNPVGKILYVGDQLLLSANLNGASSVKWQKNGKDIPGSGSTTFIINAVAITDSGSYACVGANSTGGSFTTSAAQVVVLPPTAPNILVNIPDTFAVDESDVFSLGVYVLGNVTYQWRKNGVDISTSGATGNTSAQSSQLSITTPVTLADSGYYSC
jgi:hypothetical protein